MKRETELYCLKTEEGYKDFFTNPLGILTFCGGKKKNIVKVKVRQSEENEKPTHYAWWDNKDKAFMFVFKTILMVYMCFPYGVKVEVEKGNGDIYGVIVEELK